MLLTVRARSAGVSKRYDFFGPALPLPLRLVEEARTSSRTSPVFPIAAGRELAATAGLGQELARQQHPHRNNMEVLLHLQAKHICQHFVAN